MKKKQKQSSRSAKSSQKAVVVFSGGPDSTAAALWALDNDFEPQLLTFKFFAEDQDGELDAARQVAAMLKLPLEIVDLQSLVKTYGGHLHILMHGAKRDKDIPGEKVFLPFASTLVLTVASSWAIHRGIETVIWGATKDDGILRKEYSKQFSAALGRFLSSTSEHRIRILAPLAGLHKFEILRAYIRRPDLFALTWSCTLGANVQSGTDHASVARRVAAMVAGVEDRTKYGDATFENPISGVPKSELKKMTSKRWAAILGSEGGGCIKCAER